MRSDAKKNYEHLLAVARVVIANEGAEASLRDIARKAGVGLGTLYRHFPTRDALLEALLRMGFDELAASAAKHETSNSPEHALVSWIHEVVTGAHGYRGVVTAMMAAIQDPGSALHASCVAMRSAGTRLLARAQAKGAVRADLDGTDLFALIGSLVWLRDQQVFAEREEHLFEVVMDAILTSRKASTQTKKKSTRSRRRQ